MAEPIKLVPRTTLSSTRTSPKVVVEFPKKTCPQNIEDAAGWFFKATEYEQDYETARTNIAGLHKYRTRLIEPIKLKDTKDFTILPEINRIIESTNLQMAEYDERATSAIDAAIDAYERVLRIEPQHAPACINLGTIYYNRGEFQNFHKAEELYRQATKADPDYALAWLDLGITLEERKEFGEAIECYERAVKIDPQYADAHYNLAVYYQDIGKRNKALNHFDVYQKLDPVGPFADYARSQIKIIKAMSPLRIVARRSGPSVNKVKSRSPRTRHSIPNDSGPDFPPAA